LKRLSSAPLKIRYLIIGAWNTFFGFAVFTILMIVFPISKYLIALTLTMLLAGMNSYMTQRKFVWQSSANMKAEFSKFFTVFIGQFFANLVLLYILVDYFNFHPLWTQYVIAAVLIVMTYISHKNWTFRSN
jgi:putative flippase GtrA